MYIFRELCANKFPQQAIRRDKGGIQRRESRKPRPQCVKLAVLRSGQILVRRHGVQQRVPQADFVGVGGIQQQVGARFERLDVLVLARADFAPQPKCKGRAVAAEQTVPHQAARQAHIAGGQAAGAVGGGVFFAQARVQAQGGVGRQAFGQGGVQRMEPLDDDDAVAAVDGLGAVGLLDLKIKARRFADACRVQFCQAVLQDRQVERGKALVVVGAVGVLGIAARADVEIVQADHRTAAAPGSDGIGDLVSRSRLAGGGWAGQHNDVPPAGQHFVGDGLDLGTVLPLAVVSKRLGLGGGQGDQLPADETFTLLCSAHKSPPRPACGRESPQSGQYIRSDT